MDIKSQDIIYWPRRMSKKSRKDPTKYYHFHWEYRYDTEDYFSLKKEIEALVWHGYLCSYINHHSTIEATSREIQPATKPPTRNDLPIDYPLGASSSRWGAYAKMA